MANVWRFKNIGVHLNHQNETITPKGTKTKVMETKTQETKLTDLEAFVQLYKRVGINVEIDIREDDKEKIIDLNGPYFEGEKVTKSEKFGGYAGCFSEIVFDMEGNFLHQDFWEF